MSYFARVSSAAVTPPSATAFTWATAALITWRQKRTEITWRHFTLSSFILKKKGSNYFVKQFVLMIDGYSHHQQLQPGRWCRPQTDQSQNSLHWKHWPGQGKKKKMGLLLLQLWLNTFVETVYFIGKDTKHCHSSMWTQPKPWCMNS